MKRSANLITNKFCKIQMTTFVANPNDPDEYKDNGEEGKEYVSPVDSLE